MITQNSLDPTTADLHDHPHGHTGLGDGSISEREHLAEFIEHTIGDEHLRIDEDFGQGYVRLKSSEAQRRQAAQDIRSSEDVLIELLRNSRDAGARNIFIATNRSDEERTIVVIDDGSGIPDDMHSRVFEPRVTSKLDSSHMDLWGLHGRGMALYSIKVNSRSAEVVCSQVGCGSSIKVVLDISSLGEKTDQSTFPRFEEVDSTYVMRGPKNLIRTAAEFALEHRGDLNVFFGTPAEILSTMYIYGCSTIPASKRAFASNGENEKIFKRLCFNADASSLEKAANSFGLAVSERTARRIVDGEMKSLPDLMEMLKARSFPVHKRPDVSKKRDRSIELADETLSRKVSLSDDDEAFLTRTAREAFTDIARRYFLRSDVEPSIECKKGRVIITIPTIEDME